MRCVVGRSAYDTAIRSPIPAIHVQVSRSCAEGAAVETWRNRLAGWPGRKVGLVWGGKPSHRNDHHRSIPLRMFTPLAEVTRIQFVSLQKGKAAEQIADVPALKLLDWTTELNNYDDTAALIQALDLVISVDTSVAHLAGALGRAVWTLLPFVPDFRWMLERSDSP